MYQHTWSLLLLNSTVIDNSFSGRLSNLLW